MAVALDARACAALIISDVITAGRSLSAALPHRVLSLADSRQRSLVQELSYGTLRWYYRLDALLQQLLQKPLKQRDSDIRCLLLAGLYQLTQLAMPQRVAVNETVQATQALQKDWARGLVNGVLRNYQRSTESLEARAADQVAAKYAHPQWLIDRLRADWPSDWSAVLQANNARPPFCLRVNRQRLTRNEYLELLSDCSIDASPLTQCTAGIHLAAPIPVESLPGFADGLVSVQDGAAQLAATQLQLQPGQRVLDACAAPGGKTAHILESEPALACLTAVDVDAGRLQRIEENLSRLALHADILQADASEPSSWWDGRPYDRILLDAPCSASGVIRRHPDIKVLRQPGDVATLVARQAALLQALWPLLVTGGLLLYATCSLLAEENSQQIGRFLDEIGDAEALPTKAAWGHACRHGRQILPGEDEMDGFYYACLRKLA